MISVYDCLKSVLNLLTVGPKFTWPACHVVATAIEYPYLLSVPDGPQQQTRRLLLLLLLIDGTDVWTDTRPFYLTSTAYYADCVLHCITLVLIIRQLQY